MSKDGKQKENHDKDRLYKIITSNCDGLIENEPEISGQSDDRCKTKNPPVCKKCEINTPVSNDEEAKNLCVKCIFSLYQGQQVSGNNKEPSIPQQKNDANSSSDNDSELNFDDIPEACQYEEQTLNYILQFQSMDDIVKYTPLRLTMKERSLLRILEAALNASEYTDKVDIIASQRAKRMATQIREICSIIAGLIVATDYNLGQNLFRDRDYARNVELYREMLGSIEVNMCIKYLR